MALPKLILVFQQLDAKQCSDLKKFMLMYMGKSSDLYHMAEHLLKERMSFQSPVDLQKLASKCGIQCSHKTFMNMFSQLFQYTENWIAFTQLNHNDYEKQLLIQQWLNKKGLYNLSDQLVSKAMQTISCEKKFDLAEHQYKAAILFEQFFSNNPGKYDFDKSLFEEMVYAFDQYVATVQLLLLTESSSLEQIVNTDLSSIKANLQAKVALRHRSENTNDLELLFDLVDKNHFENLLEVKGNLLAGKYKTGTKLHHIIHSVLLNKANNLFGKGLLKDVGMVQELMEYGIKHHVFFNNGKISVVTFHSLVARSLPFYNFKQIESFIHQWIHNVETSIPNSTKDLAMAQNCLYNKRYKEIYKYTRRGEFEVFTQKTLAMSLHLLVCFVDRNTDRHNFNYAIQTSSYFLKRNRTKLSTHLFNAYNNLILLLVAYDKAVDKSTINIDDYKPLSYRFWIEDYINQKKKERV